MKTVLCFGDSNTWGYDPSTGGRYPKTDRWVGVLAQALGPGFDVIAEGQNGRTTVFSDPVEGGHKSGLAYLPACLESCKPVDLVVIMLGTNDMKARFAATPGDIASGAAHLVARVQQSDAGPEGGAPRVLLLAPPPIAKLSEFGEMFEGAQAKSCLLGARYREVAAGLGCEFLDTSTVVRSSDLDGIHLDAGDQRKLGQAVAARVKALLGP